TRGVSRSRVRELRIRRGELHPASDPDRAEARFRDDQPGKAEGSVGRARTHQGARPPRGFRRGTESVRPAEVPGAVGSVPGRRARRRRGMGPGESTERQAAMCWLATWALAQLAVPEGPGFLATRRTARFTRRGPARLIPISARAGRGRLTRGGSPARRARPGP